MNKRIVALLMAFCLVCLTACGGNAGVDDTPPPNNSIEPTETPSESIVEPSVAPSTEPPIEESTLTIEPTVEPPVESSVEPSTEPTQSTNDGNTSTPTPTTETKPSNPTATTTPVQTATPTATPEPVHTHSYSVTQNPTCSTDGIKKCSCGDTITIPATGHTYITQTIPATGHNEQVQVGTEQVIVRYETRQYSKCNGCGAIAYTNEEMYGHYDSESPYFSPSCAFATNLIYTEQVPVYEEQPKYEIQWVEDSPAYTIQVCSVCGQQQ